MGKIKLIDKNTDLSRLKPIGWDLVIGDIPYDVYHVDGYFHTIGGRHGNNCFWACPAAEAPTYINMVQFNGEAPAWGIAFTHGNYTSDKHEVEIKANGSCWITRNGKNFIHIPAREMSYGLAKAQYMLVRILEECPLGLNERGWEEKAIGRKIWYDNQPAIIARITSNNELWIVPDNDEGVFKAPNHWQEEEEMDYSDYENGMVVEILSPNINWYRK